MPMEPGPFAARAGAFVRSVLPAEPAHWLLLLGATFLFISPELRWWPIETRGTTRPYEWLGLTKGLTLPILFAGVAAYRLVLVPCRRAVLWLSVAVLLPAVLGILAVGVVGLIWYPDEIGLNKFLLDSVMRGPGDYWSAIPHVALNLGPGSMCASVGATLVAVFTIILGRGKATLPIRLRPESILETNDPVSDYRRTDTFIWTMIALTSVGTLIEAGIFVPFLIHFRNSRILNSNVIVLVDQLISGAVVLLLVLVALGKDLKCVVSKWAKACAPTYFALAVLIPILIASVWPLILFIRDTSVWAEFDLGQFASPRIEQYFGLPPSVYLVMLFPAFVEEIAWRGYLQPVFVKRYGILRGIFLVGMVWGPFHFSGDFNVRMAAAAVLLTVIRRLAETVAQSYAFGWLAISSRSILPSTLAHGFFNMFLAPRIPTHTPIWIMIGLWAIAGYVLFRYFPPSVAEDSRQEDTSRPPEVAQPDYS